MDVDGGRENTLANFVVENVARSVPPAAPNTRVLGAKRVSIKVASSSTLRERVAL
jgi:hypothetical protein